MRYLIMIMVFALASISAFAKPHCLSFNNHDNKVTIVFTDEEADGEYIVSDVKLFPIENGEGYDVNSIDTNVTDGFAKVTLTFPHLTKFSNPYVELTINGKKEKFTVSVLSGTWNN